MSLKLMIIDPQNDFSDFSDAALPVPGAGADAQRLAKLINRLGNTIDSIHVTLDTHQLLDIAHPMFWIDAQGSRPPPFTQITVEDVESGRWRPAQATLQQRALEYVHALRNNHRYVLTVWPPHCLVGTWGHNVIPAVQTALQRWEERHWARVDYHIKGHNPWTEHYSAIQADVPDPNDRATQVNRKLIESLQQADTVLLSGQALSHCVANTVRDMTSHFGGESIHKLVLLEDTCSAIPGFEKIAYKFITDMKQYGMRIIRSTEFFC